MQFLDFIHTRQKQIVVQNQNIVTMSSKRRLSNASQEAFTDFCNKNQPLSRRRSSNFDEPSISSTLRRDSITKRRERCVLKRRNQSGSRAKKRDTELSDLKNGERNSPQPKKRRTTRRKSQINVQNGIPWLD